jgi:hypothetical protein
MIPMRSSRLRSYGKSDNSQASVGATPFEKIVGTSNIHWICSVSAFSIAETAIADSDLS